MTTLTNQPTPVVLDEAALEEIEARANAATPGPWVIVESALPDDWGVTEGKLGTERKGLFRRKPRHQSIAQMLWEEDAPFVAHARTDIPALCQTVRALREENERLRELVRHMQFPRGG